MKTGHIKKRSEHGDRGESPWAAELAEPVGPAVGIAVAVVVSGAAWILAVMVFLEFLC